MIDPQRLNLFGCRREFHKAGDAFRASPNLELRAMRKPPGGADGCCIRKMIFFLDKPLPAVIGAHICPCPPTSAKNIAMFGAWANKRL
jgi:hypothetical protein